LEALGRSESRRSTQFIGASCRKNVGLIGLKLMRILDWNALDSSAQQAALTRPAQDNPERKLDVARLIAQIRADGDHSARALTRRFDGTEIGDFAVSQAEFDACEAKLTEPLKLAMRAAYQRIRSFHEATAPKAVAVNTAPGVLCERIPIAIDRVGLYVPAGSAPLPSTALMLGVPAQLAGSACVCICSPPNENGEVHATVLYAALLCGIKRVYKIGGVQAIAAMAYGTQSIAKCDKIFGPGNAWVTEAKQQVSQDPEGAAIDMPAGPSEVLVIADEFADAEIVAADLLSQAEHGPDSQVVLLSPSRASIEKASTEINAQAKRLPRAEVALKALAHARLILVRDLKQAIEISNRYAPEHLIINALEPRSLLSGVRNAGSVFLGALTPESTGDYNAGTNHVLPTYGYARAYSGVSVNSFVKLVTVQTLTKMGLQSIGPEAVVFAKAEGLDAHAVAVQMRLDKLASGAFDGPQYAQHSPSVMALVRPDFQGFKGYSSARMEAKAGGVFLNANEAPISPLNDDAYQINRYPEPQPAKLVERLAELYGVSKDQLLLGRGSDEPIDLLTRAFCRPGVDRVMIMPPTFGMYKVCADVQGADVLQVPLKSNDGFAPDWIAAKQALARNVKLSYICTPNNPTGDCVDAGALRDFIEAARGLSVVIVDEAYGEFSADINVSAIALLAEYDHVVILRTLSKAYGLAGARLGVAIAHPKLISLLRSLQAPYPIPTPVAALALTALADQDAIAARLSASVAQRNWLRAEMQRLPGVTKIWPSAANFLSFCVPDAKAIYLALAARGVIVRDVSHYIGLSNHLRVSIGTAIENQQFLTALTEALKGSAS
jgi:histidinol dehydrogenase